MKSVGTIIGSIENLTDLNINLWGNIIGNTGLKLLFKGIESSYLTREINIDYLFEGYLCSEELYVVKYLQKL